NGAGKSTTLKLISKISYPTEGSVGVRGRIASLIEVGAGLHPELTGRDNVFVNAAIMGMTRAETEQQFDAIVAFAELQEFMNMPVKRYSSGMYVRLGFSVAVHTDPDILLVDEVLSVGDVAFQAKSLERMLAFKEKGVSIVFVSHNLPAVAQMCDRVLWIDNGQLSMLGGTAQVLEAYLDAQDRKLTSSRSPQDIRGEDLGSGDIVIERITTHRSDGTPATDFSYREPLLLRIHYRAFTEITRPCFIVAVSNQFGALFAANMQFDERFPERLSGLGIAELLFEELPLLPGPYHVMGQIRRNVASNYYNPKILAAFTLRSALETYGYSGKVGLANSRNSAPIVVPYEWRFPAEGVDGFAG
ncbi:MAG: polysaccharide ABC transporter ATP-binding protein, partial [Vicinamibacteria bacterium]